MIPTKPTQNELDVFFDVLDYIIKYHKENEPHAKLIINAAELVYDQAPPCPEDYDE